MLERGGILVVDDDPSYRNAVERILLQAGIAPVRAIPDGSSVHEEVETMRPEAVCLDLDLGSIDGKVVLEELKESWPDLGVVIMTGKHDLATVLDCMRWGAGDFLPKPFGAKDLLDAVRRVSGTKVVPAAAEARPAPVPADAEAFEGIVASSASMAEMFQQARDVACSPLPVLVTGETGTGKELVARALHRLRAPDRPFVAVNTAGLDDTMFTDTLFGHVGGAFTGGEKARSGLVEAAGDGTLFLDEIGDLSPASQVKLLRLLQESEYYPIGSDVPRRSRCRFVVATHRDLGSVQGFRADLYWRLQSHRVRVPALRERMEDIAPLCQHFAREAAREMGKIVPTFPDAFLKQISAREFPGNVRELRGLVYDLVARNRGFHLEPRALPTEPQLPLDEQKFPTLEAMLQSHIERAVERCGGNRTAAAELLGISRQTLITRLKRGASEKRPVS